MPYSTPKIISAPTIYKPLHRHRYKGLSLRRNFSWNLVGNVIYAGCQWGMLVVPGRNNHQIDIFIIYNLNWIVGTIACVITFSYAFTGKSVSGGLKTWQRKIEYQYWQARLEENFRLSISL